MSSKNSRTLKLITSTKPNTKMPQTPQEQSNVNFLKNKISNKLNRQNTHTILKKGSSTISSVPVNSRVMSTSAPPAINRSKCPESLHSSQGKNIKQFGTSSFSSPRRTLTPNNYANANLDRFGEQQRFIKIEGGVGRRTPISNILDKATSIDKLWSSQKRNERIDFTKLKPKNIVKTSSQIIKPILSSQIKTSDVVRQCSPPVTHKSRDMLRTSEKIQRMKNLNQHTKSVPCLFKKDTKSSKEPLSAALNTSKSISNLIPLPVKSQNNRQVKSAIITNLKKKKSASGNIIVAKPIQVCSAEKKGNEVKTKFTKENLNKSIERNTRGLLKVSSNGISRYSKCRTTPKSDINSNNISCNTKALKEDLNNAYDSFDSNTFFQNLFLRNMEPLLTKEMSNESCAGLVFEKAKLFQSSPDKIVNYSHSNSLNTYLINRKPVSLSRFVKWDRNPSPVSDKKPRSISWPGKMDGKIRKFESLHVPRSEMGSTSSLTSIRSKSEPPVHKLYFSQTSRPVSPTVIFHKKTVQRFSSPPKSSFIKNDIKSINKTHTRGNYSISPTNKSFTTKNVPISKLGVPQNKDEWKMIKSRVPQSSRSISPQDGRSICFSRSHSTSPISIRSPSYRKIYLSRTQNKLEKLIKKENRSYSAESKGNRNYDMDMTRVSSEPNLYSDDPEYFEYIRDIQSTKSRSERFRELNRYYAYLERVSELEKATDNNNVLLTRKKDEEIIDFDRWKKIRSIERAEEELNNLYVKLRQAQRDNDILFYPRDVEDFRWKFDSERGLKIKEKSVEDLKSELQQKSCNEYGSLDLQKSSDTYKPLWRGKSVAETAFDINNKKENKKEKIQPIRTQFVLQDDSFQDIRKKIGIGNRLWSSLSIDQVTALKDQLNAIYSKELESKSLVKNEPQNYEIEVNNMTKKKNPNLYVRCSSLGTPRETSSITDSETLVKSQSIASIDSAQPTEKEMKNNANKMQMSLTECEKKLMSQNISKEVLNKLNKLDQMGFKIEKSVEDSISFDKKCYSASYTKNELLDKNKKQNEIKTRHVIYPNRNTTTSNQSSASETDTGSSDVSTKTVICKDSKIEVKKKVEYFESVKSVQNQPKTIFHAKESSDEQKEKSSSIQLTGKNLDRPIAKNLICQSQSCTNFKELFGESISNNFLSLPLKTAVHSRSSSPYSGVHERDRNTPDTLLYSSNETISRSRSPSPDPVRVWRTYLKFSRGGEVRRLVRRFDSPSSVGAILRRHRSDPEIARNVYKNNWSTIEGEPSQRRKWKTLTVARVPLRPTNRFMPHIDIISKLAALRKRPTTRSRSAEEAIECRPGEVERIRRKFETMSLLGQIYSSAPDIRELNEFPFLAGSWIAHQYPKPSDNNRSVTSPDKFVRGRISPVKKEVKMATTKKPPKLNTILKNEPLSTQAFDPEVHRPASRYEPPRTPPRPPPAAWPYHLTSIVMPSRNTVTFQEGESVPEPPRRSAYGSYSDTESPNRRYVESDVNIHYRCPVRRDPLPLVPERELARQQAEHMKSLYREQKRNKYLQELQDAQNRRHQDNFMPSQKLVIPPNRYDEADRIVARALYTFNGQTSRELSFRKGDFINVRRQIDANWYEGEIHGRLGLFPYNYVELLKGDGSRSPRRSAIIEGRAKAKFDFTAQTNLELPLKKGEIVTLTRRIDQNWWEGRNASKTGIFPDSYVTVLQEPSQSKTESQPILNTDKPVASPAAHGLLNGSDKRSMGTHSYTPQQNSSALANAPPATQPLPGYSVSKAQRTATPSDRGYGPPTGAGVDLNNTEPLYVDTNAEAIPYRAMYKYRPQNPDELELNEGDTVYVLEKCDDGWYVGSSQRTGRFGTFPGNYVERI